MHIIGNIKPSCEIDAGAARIKIYGSFIRACVHAWERAKLKARCIA